MEELTQREKLLFDRLPLAAMQLRTALGGIYFGARRMATPEERENDPELDRNAAVLYRSYYQLLRLAKDLESVELLGREEPLPRENLDLLVWLDEIIRECQVPFELKGVTLELLCSERYVITAVNKRWLEQAWDVLMVMLLRFLCWLAQLLPRSAPTGDGAAAPADMSGFGDMAAEPSLLAVILEKVAYVIAGIAAAAAAVFAVRFLYRQLKKLARRLMDMMRRYAAAATEDYDDEITDTREDGERGRNMPLQALRRRLALGDDKSLPPAERIRRRYARLRLKHADWQDSRTARETLPDDAAQLYERARYSEHPVTGEDAEDFARRTRSV